MVHTYWAKMIRILDGDTMEVQFDLGFDLTYTREVRIIDYDAPETWRPCNENERIHGKFATWKAEELLEIGEWYKIQVFDRGKYGRPIIDIFFPNGERFSDIMKEEGLEKLDEY